MQFRTYTFHNSRIRREVAAEVDGAVVFFQEVRNLILIRSAHCDFNGRFGQIGMIVLQRFQKIAFWKLNSGPKAADGTAESVLSVLQWTAVVGRVFNGDGAGSAE